MSKFQNVLYLRPPDNPDGTMFHAPGEPMLPPEMKRQRYLYDDGYETSVVSQADAALLMGVPEATIKMWAIKKEIDGIGPKGRDGIVVETLWNLVPAYLRRGR